ncbi:16S rRNA (guanine(966)-N(2))-methyltransferase RsmD [Tuanshanicoccus lijuaniae]|uniref:16S rRNA (guanine(966)-N(2))-methyltransferase RsmD n=1 Tax=Aerococcaceae bacterium zg-1292 TaxID=2774330 RepID=UPI0019367596|nr:16S rRNA (guanine(966)-N(2))-methyltransferase RsmD [Aerococcaceae bacterium zg-1292]QQA37736.1 16S rRNA (guanine(966)-N(2))-methyltransferase RsmD [Aerococcaceae bacterium zg-1292]
MRVVAGKYGSRPLKAVPGKNTRPTTDKIKESLFSMLGGFFDGGTVLDLYGGTGGLAIEAISRGMDKAYICEQYRPALKIIAENIVMTKEPERFIVLAGNNRQQLAQLGDVIFDLVLIDPPYKKQMIEQDVEWLAQHRLISEDTIILCETDDETQLPDTLLNWYKIKFKTYGNTHIHVYQYDETLNA